MAEKKKRTKIILKGMEKSPDWEESRTLLEAHGIDLDACCETGEPPEGRGKVKIVCVAPDLQDSVLEMGKTPRDRVLMVRVDEETSRDLDAWVASGAVKSRSEAAALFIREGLKVRSSELESLRGALDELEAARTRLRDEARKVFGKDEERELE